METDVILDALKKAIENENENIALKMLLVFSKEKIEELEIRLSMFRG